MLHALAYAFVDAVNVLLIGVLVALAMMSATGRYARVASLLIFGDWLGVLLLALVVLLAFDGLGEFVKHVVESAVFGILLILTGVVTAILTIRGGDSSALMNRILEPLRSPSPLTVVVGLILGVIQSATSVPFFAGLAVLSASDIPAAQRYSGLFLYATVALSLPIITALLLGLVRRAPDSFVSRGFAKARANKEAVVRAAGYLVAVLLVAIGVLRLL
ncbi:hypothetical protein GOARA_063_01100 [Gordonia araii NBRC 100433]|uniref:Uncharacterized protein n=1 Tax=Gordonia araii NBRC 100433 TaxID=1073574 RepID=G7H4Y6_9ACTN|nr:hypothetical protein [Gordonia araii]NNG96601.1 hypothetical protein [Gordonia araii NBRC 100433]GAB10911.1 hypothetical protein GOARA_063_01100 [Gordonia araii NBRC 100433]